MSYPDGYAIRGVDLSSIQTTRVDGRYVDIDWKKVAASGVRFAYARCGYGNEPPDEAFHVFAGGAEAAGIAVGAYHVGFPIRIASDPGADPVSQARAHFAASQSQGINPGELPPALDLEWPVPGTPEWSKHGCTPEFVREWALGYLAEMRELLGGRLPVLYDGFPNYWSAIGGSGEPRFKEYPLWRVDYRPKPVTPGPWEQFTLWQCGGGGSADQPATSTTHLPNGAIVDEDVFRGDEEAWREFLMLDVTGGGEDTPVYAAPAPDTDRDPEV